MKKKHSKNITYYQNTTQPTIKIHSKKFNWFSVLFSLYCPCYADIIISNVDAQS